MATTLTRRNPIADMLGWLDSESFFGTRGPGLTPYVHIEDFVEDGTYVLRAEMPGIDPDKDVRIDIDGDVLTIQGERREEKKERNRHEFHYGSFSRSLTLPRGADADKIKAEYKDGVLELRVPMDGEGEAPRRIEVQHG
ncbi:MAG TPA: Hsp20/alpha crystallin family protein [Nocardioides sp.]|nr:Hsp20/alpha crystallin family protein [Nocardioides sp.]